MNEQYELTRLKALPKFKVGSTVKVGVKTTNSPEKGKVQEIFIDKEGNYFYHVQHFLFLMPEDHLKKSR